MRTLSFVLGCIFCLLASSVSAQWVQQELPSFFGTPQMLYPGKRSAPEKDVLWTLCYNFGNDTIGIPAIQSLRTDNNGATWQVSEVIPDKTALFYVLTPVNGQLAYMTTHSFINGENKVYRTTDGGANWNALSIQPETFLNQAVFFNTRDGLLVCDPDSLGVVMLYTNDGGDTWQRHDPTDMPKTRAQEFFDGGIYQVIGDVVFQATTDYETGERRMWRSLDQGKTWTAGEWFVNPTFFVANYIFTDENNGITFYSADGDQVFSTADGGATWQPTGEFPAPISSGPLGWLPNTNQVMGIFTDTIQQVLFSAITNDYGKTWHTRKDLGAYTLDDIYAPGTPPFAWSNLEILDNRTAWAKFSRTTIHRYDGIEPLVPEQPDLDLSLTASNEELPLWKPIKYTLKVTNRGINSATGVRINWLPPFKRVGTGPEPFAFVTSSASKGRFDTWNGIWTLPELAPGESATATCDLFVVKNNQDVLQMAQVLTCNEDDVDSTPGNMTDVAKEDDEVQFINKATTANNAASSSSTHESALALNPNPTDDKVAFTVTDFSDNNWSLKVINEAGQLVFEQQGSQIQVIDFNTAQLPTGIYFVHFDNGMLKQVETLLIQR